MSEELKKALLKQAGRDHKRERGEEIVRKLQAVEKGLPAREGVFLNPTATELGKGDIGSGGTRWRV